MPTIARLPKSRIDVYANDHLPPHFHIRANEGSKAAVTIREMRLLAGDVPRATFVEAVDWATPNRPLLYRMWKELNS